MELPASLKPNDPNVFWCTNRAGGEAVSDAFKENKASHTQIKSGVDSGDILKWVAIIVITGATMYEVGKANPLGL